jgi:hypothetical protein
MRDLDAARAKRWWRTARPVASIERASAFIDDVGFALLFPKAGVTLPSLWEAASDRPIHDLPGDWGPDIERVWWWKDEIPRRRLAWYGRFLRGRPSFLSRALLADLYPRAGRPDDFRDAGLERDARRVAETLLKNGPMPTSLVREAVGLEGKNGGPRFSAALSELGRALVATHFGAEDEGSGWPSAVLELTARAFRIRRPGDRVRAARRFLGTTLVARPADLARAFGWTAAEARAALEGVVTAGEASREGAAFTLTHVPHSPGTHGSARRKSLTVAEES